MASNTGLAQYLLIVFKIDKRDFKIQALKSLFHFHYFLIFFDLAKSPTYFNSDSMV